MSAISSMTMREVNQSDFRKKTCEVISVNIYVLCKPGDYRSNCSMIWWKLSWTIKEMWLTTHTPLENLKTKMPCPKRSKSNMNLYSTTRPLQHDNRIKCGWMLFLYIKDRILFIAIATYNVHIQKKSSQLLQTLGYSDRELHVCYIIITSRTFTLG